MIESNAQYYPEHDRMGCSDKTPINAEASGSGCARCTALVMDRSDLALTMLRLVEYNLGKGMSKSMQKLQARSIDEFIKENHLD